MPAAPGLAARVDTVTIDRPAERPAAAEPMLDGVYVGVDSERWATGQFGARPRVLAGAGRRS